MVETETLLAVLPGTQCKQCGYVGCRPFAEALRARESTPDACTPGGAFVRHRLEVLLNLQRELTLPDLLDPVPPPTTARIDEDTCIGCAKCLDACPVDAIIGAAHQLHAVLEVACTGCGLCLPPCPVDCITLVPGVVPASGWPCATSPAANRIRDTAAAPCIACGECVPVCPESLHPQTLLAVIGDLAFADAAAGGLARCTECRACDLACPSHIPLAAYFAHAKQATSALVQAARAAEGAALRHAGHVRRVAGRSAVVAGDPLLELNVIAGISALEEVAAAVARARHAGAQRSAAGKA